jgi:hypothetical protein
MGEEESSAIESTSITSNEPDQTTSCTSNKTSQPSLETHSTPGDYASNLNTGALHLTPDTDSTISSISHQQYRGTYSLPYPQMSSTNYSIQPSTNTLYHYQQQQTPYRTQQYDQPQ